MIITSRTEILFSSSATHDRPTFPLKDQHCGADRRVSGGCCGGCRQALLLWSAPSPPCLPAVCCLQVNTGATRACPCLCSKQAQLVVATEQTGGATLALYVKPRTRAPGARWWSLSWSQVEHKHVLFFFFDFFLHTNAPKKVKSCCCCCSCSSVRTA